MDITQRVATISPSLTLEITAKAKKMKEDGMSIISFGAGEPDFNTPQYIIDAAKKALDEGKTKYTPSAGMLELRCEICDKLKKDNGLEYTPNQIIVSNGAKHSLYNAIMALIEEEDEVLIPSPYWLTYPELVKMAGGTVKYVETSAENSFKLNYEELDEAITSKTKLLILNSPSNPTGAVYTKEELSKIAEVCLKRGIWVISDEIYEKLVYDEKHYSIAAYSNEMKEKTIVVNGMSKSYSMTGWRIGYLAAPLKIAKAIDSMQSHATSNPNTIAQCASIAALNGGEDFLREMISTFDERRKLILSKIEKIDGLTAVEPKGAFYVFVNIEKLFGKTHKGKVINGSLDLVECLLDGGVSVIPGKAFGSDNYIRLSYAVSKEDINEGLDRIENFIKKLL